MQYSTWHGFKRCDFDFMGHEAFIDDPEQVVDFICENYAL